MIVSLADFGPLNPSLDRLHKVYEDLGVQVKRIKTVDADSCFHRDAFAWTPFGLVKPQLMGKQSRQWEPECWFRCMGRQPDITLPEGFFEGADILWLHSRRCIIAMGRRTNSAGANALHDILRSRGDSTIDITLTGLPPWHEQHLLGLVNVVRGWRVYADERAMAECGDNLPDWLIDAEPLPHDEYKLKHSNWVQVDGAIIINESCVNTIRLLDSHKLDVVPVAIPELVAEGGGVACATGIVQDQLPVYDAVTAWWENEDVSA